MKFDYVGTEVFYRYKKKAGKPCLILLHGWGASSEIFKDFHKIKREFSILEIDFPPFGKSEEPNNWNLFSYANMTISLCESLKIEKANFLGHSFGGRIAILINVIKPDLVEKNILVDSAGMKPRRKISYYFKVAKYKYLKKKGKNVQKLGSNDYLSLSPKMRKTFVSIVSTNLEDYAKMIKKETLIVFGEDDKETPIYMAKRLKKLIQNSQLEIIKEAGHFCFLDKPYEFSNLILEFLRSEK